MIEILVAYILYEGDADVMWWALYAVVLVANFYRQHKEKRRELHGI